MKYSIETLTLDVMARLGEFPRPQQSMPPLSSGSGPFLSDIPWPQDVMALKVRSLLPEAGSRLIREAEALPPSSGDSEPRDSVRRLMPCGLYAAEVPLPEDFLRMGAAKMGEWLHPVAETVAPEDPDWVCQWSSEPGIAGCPTRPRAYLDRSASGLLLRLIGSESKDDVLEWLGLWRIPALDGDGDFDFPAILYPGLLSSLAKGLSPQCS